MAMELVLAPKIRALLQLAQLVRTRQIMTLRPRSMLTSMMVPI